MTTQDRPAGGTLVIAIVAWLYQLIIKIPALFAG